MQQFEKRIAGNDIIIEFGETAQISTDALIVPQAKNGGNGEARVVLADAGSQEFSAYAGDNGPLEYGSVIITSPGKDLPRSLNLVCVGSGESRAFDVVRISVLNSLKLAGQVGIRSIATPPLGSTNCDRLTSQLSAFAMVSAVVEYGLVDRGNGIPISVIIPKDRGLYRGFLHVLNSINIAPTVTCATTRIDLVFNRNNFTIEPKLA